MAAHFRGLRKLRLSALIVCLSGALSCTGCANASHGEASPAETGTGVLIGDATATEESFPTEDSSAGTSATGISATETSATEMSAIESSVAEASYTLNGIALYAAEADNPALSHLSLLPKDFAVDASVSGVVFLTRDMNVRKYPSLGSACLGMLPVGSWVMYEGITTDNGWYLISFQETEGYLRADLLPRAKEEDATSATDAASSTSPALGDVSGDTAVEDGEVPPEEVPDIFWEYINKGN